MQATSEIAERISSISVSSTLKVSADADRLGREGADVVDFGAGEPDFPTPQNIKQAAVDAITANFTKYTNAGGTPELRAAICERHKQDFGTNYTTAECMVTVGGKHAIFNLIQALVDPGDEVIIPAPYWVTYKDVVNYAGGHCVFVDTDEANGFEVTAEMIERHLSPRTKLVIINSPNNPSGSVLEAMRGPQDSVTEMLAEYRKRRDFVVARLQKIPGVKISMPKGAFYAYPNISVAFGSGRVKSAMDFASELLAKSFVAVVPGEAFGTNEHVRISYATSMAELERGLDRVEKFIDTLRA